MKKKSPLEWKTVPKELRLISDDSAVSFLTEFLLTRGSLLRRIEKLIEDKTLVNEARKDYLVILVTSIEVFCKILVLRFKDKWKKESYAGLLQEKITINDAFEVFNSKGKNKLNRVHLIIEFSSFKNIESINSVFSKLLKVEDILDEIDIFAPTFKRIHPNWRKELSQLFDTRNKIVHDRNKITIKRNKLSTVASVVFIFTTYFEKYLVSI